jgi:hypothetical protein
MNFYRIVPYTNVNFFQQDLFLLKWPMKLIYELKVEHVCTMLIYNTSTSHTQKGAHF